MQYINKVLGIFVLCFCSVTSNAQSEHPHAKILGALIYTDLSIETDGEQATSVMNELRKELGVLMQVYWETSHLEGINKTTPIYLTLEKKPAIVVLERIMEQLSEDDDIAWQIRDGVLEVGLKSRFSKRSSLKLIQYPISDLLFTIRDFDDAPEMGTSGSGGGPNIGFGSGGNNKKREPKQNQIDKIIRLIVKFVEPDQWEQNGGDCTIESFRETLLINAPDYMHRQIGGYPFEPTKPKGLSSRRVNYNNGKTTVQVLPSRNSS